VAQVAFARPIDPLFLQVDSLSFHLVQKSPVTVPRDPDHKKWRIDRIAWSNQFSA
jgi:hypothetical protein